MSSYNKEALGLVPVCGCGDGLLMGMGMCSCVWARARLDQKMLALAWHFSVRRARNEGGIIEE